MSLSWVSKQQLEKMMEMENALWGWKAAAHCKAGNGSLWGRDSAGSSHWREQESFSTLFT